MSKEKQLALVKNRIQKAVSRCWNSNSNGSVVTKIIGRESHINLYIYPAVREIVGGAQDGGICFPRFSFDLTRFYRYFDNTPYVTFTTNTGCPTISLFGSIIGIDFQVQIHSTPSVLEPNERLHTVGPKAGSIEMVVQSESEED